MHLYWRTKEKGYVSIKSLSNSHIKSCLVILDRMDRAEIDGYSKPYWILMFKRELNYRRELEKVILNELPWVRDELWKWRFN